VVNFTPQPLYFRKINPLPIKEKVWWTPETVWAVKENRKSLAPAGI
jgi:hypothetical protein